MSELLFECYNVPSVAYGIDSLFSLYNNMPSSGKLIQCCHGRLCVVILLFSEHAWFILICFSSPCFCLRRKTRHCSWSTMVRKKLQLVSVFFSFVHPHLVSYLLWYLCLFWCFKQYLLLQNSQNREHQKDYFMECYCVARK